MTETLLSGYNELYLPPGTEVDRCLGWEMTEWKKSWLPPDKTLEIFFLTTCRIPKKRLETRGATATKKKEKKRKKEEENKQQQQKHSK